MMHDLIVPGCYNEKLGHLVVALDTSGSMDDETIRAVLSEFLGMKDSSFDITLIVADCSIQAVVSGTEIIVLEIIEAEEDLVYVVFKGYNDQPSKMRIPYARIESWEKTVLL